MSDQPVRACTCCGLVQRIPPVPPRMRATCGRCGSSLLRRTAVFRSNARTAAIALAALILYPLAVSLPMIRVEQFGHHTDTSIVEGVISLLSGGHLIVGVIVLLCSIVLPLGKLLALLLLSAGGLYMRRKHKALTYHIVDWTGRWGMLDVLLVAIVVAALKIGDVMDVSAGPAALAFSTVVVLSLLAAASFDPHGLWLTESDEDGVA